MAHPHEELLRKEFDTTVAGDAVAVMHFSDGEIAKAWIHIDDQHALDEFLS
jgi:predicted membrane GTPase involved in stress response